MRRSSFTAMVVMAALVAAPAHASPVRGGAVNPDPWEKFNRGGFAINQAIDRAVIKPLSHIFHFKAGPLGQALHNFVTNLSEPVVFFNDVLQGRAARAGGTAVRFAVNSTVGVLGVVDVAKRAGIVHHDNSFGVTLGRYGAVPGPYLFIPLVGPTTVRDLFGTGVDAVADPVFWARYRYHRAIGYGVAVLKAVDARREAGPQLDALLSDAADPYATLRSTFLQDRQGEIDEARGGAASVALPDIEEAQPTGAAPSAPTGDGEPPALDQPAVPLPPASAPPESAPAPESSASVEVPGEIVLSANRADQPPAL